MNILAIECTHAALSVSVMNAGVVTEVRSADWKKAAETLVPLIDKVMAESAVDRQQLDCIAVSSGPGSFTSLRIGMAVAKGVAYGLGIPLLPVPTMPAMAASLQAGVRHRHGCYSRPERGILLCVYLPGELASGVWHDEVKRGSAADVAAAAAAQGDGIVVVGRRLNELIPLLSGFRCSCTGKQTFFPPHPSSLLPKGFSPGLMPPSLTELPPITGRCSLPMAGKGDLMFGCSLVIACNAVV